MKLPKERFYVGRSLRLAVEETISDRKQDDFDWKCDENDEVCDTKHTGVVKMIVLYYAVQLRN